MKMTDRGLLALIRHEGVVPGPYLDVSGVWTFGIGHTANAGTPEPERMQRGMPDDLDEGIRQAFRVFREDLKSYEADVSLALETRVAPHEFDALVSFHYNTGGIAKAALTGLVNAGKKDAAAAAFMNLSRPASIIPRKQAERDLFRRGVYPVEAIPVCAVDRQGKVDFRRSARVLSAAEALALIKNDQIEPLGVFARIMGVLFSLFGRA